MYEQGNDADRASFVNEVMKNDKSAMKNEMGDEGDMTLDTAMFPELQKAKQGDVVQISVMVKSVKGRTAVVEAHSENSEQEKEKMEKMPQPQEAEGNPMKEEY